MFFSHTRFFLSENGPKNWNDNNSDQQELISVNFTKQIPQGFPDPSTGIITVTCRWQQIERKFTPNQGNYTSLIIYAENGGALIDDVEVFEDCESYKYIQNKYFDNEVFGPNLIEGYNYTERAGINLYSSNVVADYGSKINFTAGKEIILSSGFNVNYGADFTGIILPCPNNYNRIINTNVNPDPNYIVPPPLLSNEKIAELNERMQSEDLVNSEITILPNPNNGNFKIIFNNAAELPESISVLDAQGRLVKVINKPMEYEYNLNLSDISAGLYLINAFYSNGSVSKKFIKQ